MLNNLPVSLLNIWQITMISQYQSMLFVAALRTCKWRASVVGDVIVTLFVFYKGLYLVCDVMLRNHIYLTISSG